MDISLTSFERGGTKIPRANALGILDILNYVIKSRTKISYLANICFPIFLICGLLHIHLLVAVAGLK